MYRGFETRESESPAGYLAKYLTTLDLALTKRSRTCASRLPGERSGNSSPFKKSDIAFEES